MKKKRVAILGATGMLGHTLYATLKEKFDLVITLRDPSKLTLLEKKYGRVNCPVVEFDASQISQNYVDKKGFPGEYLAAFWEKLGKVDFVINAIGITIPYSLEDQARTLFINGFFPRILAGVFGNRLIHITTDCVFNGKEGAPYSESSPKTPVDLYGLSKSLGEPTNCLTLRTSIIGEELEGHTGLLDWFLTQKGKTLTGFANHFWNGVTTRQFAKICDQIMTDPVHFPSSGLFHIFGTRVSKFEMLQEFRQRFQIDCEIQKDTKQELDRSLTTIYDLNSKLAIAPFPAMVGEM